MPTNDDLLFAEHAVKAGFVTRDEADASLEVQKRMEDMGVRDTIRNVLVNRGVLREGDAALVAKAAGLAPGRDPIPGYGLEARLGTGAMGSVYKAWQKGMQRHVAVKILRRDLTTDPRQVERLRREAALVGKLDHPNIVRGLDSGESNGLVWFAMEYVEGETLRDRLRRARVPVDEAVSVTRQLAEALEHAHGQGIVHRDIKPGNVLLTKQGVPRLADYGLAKGQTDDALTQIDATLGTPQYVAPEQARNPRDADIRSDIYSLGATLYTMLTGRPPFEGETLAQTLTRVLYERPVPVQQVVPEVPRTVVYVLERMMAKDRRHRYPSPGALLHDLRALEAGRLHVPAGFTGDIAAFEERRRSRRLWLAGAATIAGAAAVAVGVRWWEVESAARVGRAKAESLLAEALELPGDEPAWDGHTVQEMIRRLERVRTEFPETPAAESAMQELVRWRRQEQELVRVQDLSRRTQENPGDWPNVLARLEAHAKRLATQPDAGVALRQARATIDAVREQRDRRARREIDTLATTRNAGTLADAAGWWTVLATGLRERYFANEPSPLVAEAEAVAERFARARVRIDGLFAPWDRAAARGGDLDRGDVAAAAVALAGSDEAVVADGELTAALSALPPAGRWSRAAADRHEAARRLLDDASRRAGEGLRAEVDRLLGKRDFVAALEKVAEFERRSLPEQAAFAADQRARVEAERDAEAAGTRDAVAAASVLFLDAFGRLDSARASNVLDELERALARSPAADPAAGAFLAAARRLIEVTEQRIWDRFRGGVAAWVAGGGELTDRRSGIRYGGIAAVRTGRADVVFTYGQGQTWQGALGDILLDDVLRAGAVSLDDPDSALAVAALRITQYRIPQDPRRGLAMLAPVHRLIETARAAAWAAPVLSRLEALREERTRATQREIDDAEVRARSSHEAALDAIVGGRAEAAAESLRALLELPRMRQTEYVLGHRDEIRRDLERARRSRQNASFATSFPGARFTESEGGLAEIVWDFEDPALERAEAWAALGAAEGRVEIGSRLLVVTDRPSRGGGAAATLPVHLNHTIEWLSADDRGGPRDAPLQIRCPFQPKKRIDVSFLCRSDDPFFVAVSVCGAAAGVLSAPESLHGGRGTAIWNATDLDRPDKAFDERTRTTWLESKAGQDALRREGETRYFRFEGGRQHRVRIVKDEQRTFLWVDGRLRAEAPVRFQPGPLEDRIVISTWGPLDMDDLRIAGTLDPEWLKRK